jgi:sigma-E factor negative regulatory protein RseC
MVDNRMLCHDGIVVGIRDHHVQVKIVSQSACARCHARGVCSAADMGEKIIDAVSISVQSLQKGDAVTVFMEEKMGRQAVFYGFFLPFIVMIAVLFGSYALGSGDIKAALLGIGSLLPYYLLLYIFRDKIEKDFRFTVEKKEF